MLFAELTDRELDWTVRAGRQSGSAGGLLGTFDGIYAGYQVRPRLRLNANFGYPVESTATGRTPTGSSTALSADFGTFANAWDFSVYAVSQDYFGVTDRQAIGTEVRYFKPGITFVGLLDYDIHYQDLNNVLLLGTFALPARWTVNFNLDHRKSPSLTTRNAMIGQPVTSFDAAVRPLHHRRDRAAGPGPHRAIRYLHAVGFPAVRRTLAVVDGRREHDLERHAGLRRRRCHAGFRHGRRPSRRSCSALACSAAATCRRSGSSTRTARPSRRCR